MTGGLAWYGHKCMHGNDNVVKDSWYQQTAKSMEGALSQVCYEQARLEGFLLRSCGRMAIPVLPSLLPPTIQMESYSMAFTDK